MNVWVTPLSCSDCFRWHDEEREADAFLGDCDCWCHDRDDDDSLADVIPEDWRGEAMT